MSVLFPKVNKPREWDFRPRYYDPKKERLERLRQHEAQARAEWEAASGAEGKAEEAAAGTDAAAKRSAPYSTTLHRGSFRESRENAEHVRNLSQRQSKTIFWIAALLMLLLAYSLLS